MVVCISGLNPTETTTGGLSLTNLKVGSVVSGRGLLRVELAGAGGMEPVVPQLPQQQTVILFAMQE